MIDCKEGERESENYLRVWMSQTVETLLAFSLSLSFSPINLHQQSRLTNVLCCVALSPGQAFVVVVIVVVVVVVVAVAAAVLYPPCTPCTGTDVYSTRPPTCLFFFVSWSLSLSLFLTPLLAMPSLLSLPWCLCIYQTHRDTESQVPCSRRCSCCHSL